jgi:cytochrome c2
MIAFSANGNIAYLTVGEYGWNGWSSDGRTELSRIALSQYPDADYGKVVRIDLNTLEARHFSSGHRNAQGLTVDGEGRVWSVEHGPRGGDELNLIEDGNNYGWPNVTFGTAYNGEPIPGVQSVGRHTGYALPAYSWLPSVGISGLTAMHSSFHPTWDGDLIAVSLVGRTLFRIRLDGNRVVFTEEIPLGRRLRDIEQLEDGRLVVWTDSNEVIFLTPVDGGLGAQFVSRYLDNLATSTPDLAAAMNEMVVECSECHSFSSREHRIGPDLSNVSGRGIGAIESFEYSPALLGASGTWTANYLAEFLDDPDGVFPGTTMPDPGIDDPQVIDAMVELLDALAQAELRD